MNFRRYYIPNAIIFITNVVHNRQPIFAHKDHLDLLRQVLIEVKRLHPFAMLGHVFLPDHFHLLIRPTGESNFSKIMGSCKTNFAREYKKMIGLSGSMKFWQKRFYDHVIRNEEDLGRHLHYIHYNAVKHGYVTRPEDWPYSSFQHWKERGAYPDQWGWSLPDTLATFHVDE